MKNYNSAMKAIEASLAKTNKSSSRSTGLAAKKDKQASSENDVADILASYIMNIRKSTKEIVNGKA